jgi:hypothetical protein
MAAAATVAAARTAVRVRLRHAAAIADPVLN